MRNAILSERSYPSPVKGQGSSLEIEMMHKIQQVKRDVEFHSALISSSK